jgi:hypothetical protein
VIVTRTSDSQDCPDTDDLVARVAAIRAADAPRPDAPPPRGGPTLSVAFGRAGDTYFAAIRSSQVSGSVRRLEVPGTTCAGLARATAVTLALLLDADAAGESAPPPPPPAPPPPPPPRETRPADAPAPPPRAPNHVTLAAGASALFVTLRPLAPAVTGEVGVEVGAWRARAGVLWAPEQSLALGPGTVTASIRAGSARVCYAPWRSGGLRADVCTGAYFGAESASGQGYTRDDRRTRPWVAIPLEATLGGRDAYLGWELGAAALVSVVRQDFAIDNLGEAYRAPLVGAMLSLRAIALVPW